ncbi:HU family DNA-binding protein [Salmonirosea aquatica]|uniref:HU family DNA-binding protein n=1 Tax=Salmonirosea aquatica TaxID=2654236 RepID=UPI003570A21E
MYTLKYISTVTKADVIAQISEKTGVEKADVQQTLETFFTVVKDSLADGENLYVRGFGSFINKKRARKVARNISKGESMIIDEHFVPSFKPAKVFVEQVKTSDSLKSVVEK